jgi:hypothetical protein
MTISGKTLREHIHLLTPLFGLIAAVWVLRWSLYQMGVPLFFVRYMLSVTVIVPICILLAALLIHAKRFGGYVNAVVAAVLLVLWSQFLIVVAILVAVITGIENVYTLAEFSAQGPDPNHIQHMWGQMTFGIGFESLSGSLVACLFLYMLRRLSPIERGSK